jgi:hypothetical protein
LVAAVTVSLAGQAPSPLSGTWKLNLEKSTYDPTDLAPKSTTTRYEVTGDAVKATIDGVDAQGRTTHAEYTAKMDGKDYPWKGTRDGKPNPDQDAVSWKKIDDHTYELTNKRKGQALTTVRIVVAQDGMSRTNTVTGTNAKGQAVNHTVVYDKQ